ncbi:MAG: argininosuccinate lyase [Gammaproteobacteria bacterium]|nr:MAG: argininosuccinate lyase [Gammaproteobacteria bacterium]
MTQEKPWGGRFAEGTDALVERFTASLPFDRRLYRQDIQGSMAHARMLAKIGVLSREELDAILQGLSAIEGEIASGTFPWSEALEDVHMNIEARLVALIGEVGKKLHTARSRNDQVATDLRLYLREAIDDLLERLKGLQLALIEKAEQEAGTLMPGFTHLQVAQPVTFGHHLMAWEAMLARDRERLRECRRRVNVLPLGSAALAGTPFPIDRMYVAELLGFEAVSENSLDAVSDRDFAIEFCADASLLMMHLSRMAEELVLWASPFFGFVELPDRFCTGSSIMPQKKNPDVPELIRGKSGRVFGHLQALLTLMKAQPLAYNKDNQEDKEPLFDAVDTVAACLEVFAALVPALEPNRAAMGEAAEMGFSTATDLADYLVRKGVPFRDAHEAVGRAVRYAIEHGRKSLADLSLEELRRFAPVEEDVFQCLTAEGSVASRRHIGGTAPQAVLEACRRARERLS